MSFVKNKTFGWWQFPINMPSLPGLAILVRKYNTKKDGQGFIFRLIYEDLISVSINNHYGQLATRDNGDIDIETIVYQLNYNTTDIKECIQALIDCDLIEFNTKQQKWYIKNVDQFIGSKSKGYKIYSKKPSTLDENGVVNEEESSTVEKAPQINSTETAEDIDKDLRDML